MALMGPISGRFSDRYGWRRFTVGGLVLSVSGMLILSRLSENSPVIMVIGGLVLQNSGMGLFYSPNSSSILSAVERERYGVISAFVNLIRNSANVTSIAIATAIVTATMGYMGFEPSLEAVSSGDGGEGVIGAFVSGLRNAYLAMLGLLVVGLAVSTFKGERLRERVPEVEAGTG
jgi:MFS family permease